MGRQRYQPTLEDRGADTESERKHPVLWTLSQCALAITKEAGRTHLEQTYIIFPLETSPLDNILHSSGIDMSQSHAST